MAGWNDSPPLAYPTGIMRQTDKAHPRVHFSLTGMGCESYFAGSPQAIVVVGRQPSQSLVGRVWKAATLSGDRRWSSHGW